MTPKLLAAILLDSNRECETYCEEKNIPKKTEDHIKACNASILTQITRLLYSTFNDKLVQYEETDAMIDEGHALELYLNNLKKIQNQHNI